MGAAEAASGSRKPQAISPHSRHPRRSRMPSAADRRRQPQPGRARSLQPSPQPAQKSPSPPSSTSVILIPS
eukprot:gene8720-33692_t